MNDAGGEGMSAILRGEALEQGNTIVLPIGTTESPEGPLTRAAFLAWSRAMEGLTPTEIFITGAAGRSSPWGTVRTVFRGLTEVAAHVGEASTEVMGNVESVIEALSRLNALEVGTGCIVTAIIAVELDVRGGLAGIKLAVEPLALSPPSSKTSWDSIGSDEWVLAMVELREILRDVWGIAFSHDHDAHVPIVKMLEPLSNRLCHAPLGVEGAGALDACGRLLSSVIRARLVDPNVPALSPPRGATVLLVGTSNASEGREFAFGSAMHDAVLHIFEHRARFPNDETPHIETVLEVVQGEGGADVERHRHDNMLGIEWAMGGKKYHVESLFRAWSGANGWGPRWNDMRNFLKLAHGVASAALVDTIIRCIPRSEDEPLLKQLCDMWNISTDPTEMEPPRRYGAFEAMVLEKSNGSRLFKVARCLQRSAEGVLAQAALSASQPPFPQLESLRAHARALIALQYTEGEQRSTLSRRRQALMIRLQSEMRLQTECIATAAPLRRPSTPAVPPSAGGVRPPGGASGATPRGPSQRPVGASRLKAAQQRREGMYENMASRVVEAYDTLKDAVEKKPDVPMHHVSRASDVERQKWERQRKAELRIAAANGYFDTRREVARVQQALRTQRAHAESTLRHAAVAYRREVADRRRQEVSQMVVAMHDARCEALASFRDVQRRWRSAQRPLSTSRAGSAPSPYVVGATSGLEGIQELMRRLPSPTIPPLSLPRESIIPQRMHEVMVESCRATPTVRTPRRGGGSSSVTPRHTVVPPINEKLWKRLGGGRDVLSAERRRSTSPRRRVVNE